MKISTEEVRHGSMGFQNTRVEFSEGETYPIYPADWAAPRFSVGQMVFAIEQTKFDPESSEFVSVYPNRWMMTKEWIHEISFKFVAHPIYAAGNVETYSAGLICTGYSFHNGWGEKIPPYNIFASKEEAEQQIKWHPLTDICTYDVFKKAIGIDASGEFDYDSDECEDCELPPGCCGNMSAVRGFLRKAYLDKGLIERDRSQMHGLMDGHERPSEHTNIKILFDALNSPVDWDKF